MQTAIFIDVSAVAESGTRHLRLREIRDSAIHVRHASNRLNSSAALVPPKPNEFDSAYSIGSGRLALRHVVEIAARRRAGRG